MKEEIFFLIVNANNLLEIIKAKINNQISIDKEYTKDLSNKSKNAINLSKQNHFNSIYVTSCTQNKNQF